MSFKRFFGDKETNSFAAHDGETNDANFESTIPLAPPSNEDDDNEDARVGNVDVCATPEDAAEVTIDDNVVAKKFAFELAYNKSK
jgi:hypothetical protein